MTSLRTSVWEAMDKAVCHEKVAEESLPFGDNDTLMVHSLFPNNSRAFYYLILIV